MSMTYTRSAKKQEDAPRDRPSRLIAGVVAAAVVVGAVQLAIVETCHDIKDFILKRHQKPKRF